MAKRAVRIVKHIGPVPCVAVCTYCSQQFKTPTTASVKEATDDLQRQFDAHKCKLLDSGQSALRIVHESTGGK